MSDPTVMLLHRWFEEVWNKGREEAIDEMLAVDAVAHGLGDSAGQDLIGPEGFKPFFRRFRAAFPSLQITVDETITEGQRIAARCTVRARHEGAGFGILPTHNPVLFSGIVMIRVRDGQLVEAWNHFDFSVMYQQLAAK